MVSNSDEHDSLVGHHSPGNRLAELRRKLKEKEDDFLRIMKNNQAEVNAIKEELGMQEASEYLSIPNGEQAKELPAPDIHNSIDEEVSLLDEERPLIDEEYSLLDEEYSLKSIPDGEHAEELPAPGIYNLIDEKGPLLDEERSLIDEECSLIAEECSLIDEEVTDLELTIETEEKELLELTIEIEDKEAMGSILRILPTSSALESDASDSGILNDKPTKQDDLVQDSSFGTNKTDVSINISADTPREDEKVTKVTKSSSNCKKRRLRAVIFAAVAACVIIIATSIGIITSPNEKVDKDSVDQQRNNVFLTPLPTTASPSLTSSMVPSLIPSLTPSILPTVTASASPTTTPSGTPSAFPTVSPTTSPFYDFLQPLLTDPTVLDDPTSLQSIAFQFILNQPDVQTLLSNNLDNIFRMRSTQDYSDNASHTSSTRNYNASRRLQNTKPLFSTKEKLVQRFAIYVMYMSLVQPYPLVPPDNDECDLPFVTCGNGIHNVTGSSSPVVEEFDLSKNILKGTLPAEIGLLTSLIHLDLGENQIHGSIPDEFYELSNLRRLYLHNNRISGSLSESIGNMQKLEDLYLSDNQLSGSIPRNIRSPSNNPDKIRPLKYLYLNQNNFTGNIPEDLRLKRTFVIDFSFNRLSGTIPYSMFDRHHALRHLYLNNNKLRGTIPANIGSVGNGRLRDALLNDNRLTGGIPTFENVDGLFNLNMQHNKFTRWLNKDICKMSVWNYGEIADMAVDCNICSCSKSVCNTCYR